VTDALAKLAEHYREKLGLAWWEPDEERRAALAKMIEKFGV